jgi:hypothetical protein
MIARNFALATAAGLLVASPPANAQSSDLEERLRELESAYTELLIRDGEKKQEIERLRDRLQAVEGQPGAHAGHDEHDHDHDHAGHDHAGHDHAEEGDAAHAHTHRPPREARETVFHHGHSHESDVLHSFGDVDVLIPSVGFDSFYYAANRDGGISHVLEGVDGFGHAHAGEEDEHEEHEHEHEEEAGHGHGHDHGHDHGPDEGFNLRHLEIGFGARAFDTVDVVALVNATPDEIELEEGYARFRDLPGGFDVTAGKFLSDFGLVNARHSPEQDFVDQPLVYKTLLGDHGIQELGVQAVWTAPSETVPLQLGGEIFQGDGESLFAQAEGEGLDDQAGPRLFVGWASFPVDVAPRHRLYLEGFGGYGDHQEAHDGDEDGTDDHFLDGSAWFAGAAASWGYDAEGSRGQGDILVEAEYFYREKDLEIAAHDLVPAAVGRERTDRQDGYYVQGSYGIFPGARLGARWEQIGLINEQDLPDGTSNDFGTSWRASGIAEYRPWDSVALRAQLNHGQYEVEGEAESLWEGYAQLVLTFGPHQH